MHFEDTDSTDEEKDFWYYMYFQRDPDMLSSELLKTTTKKKKKKEIVKFWKEISEVSSFTLSVVAVNQINANILLWTQCAVKTAKYFTHTALRH